jgi:hypothetical protein
MPKENNLERQEWQSVRTDLENKLQDAQSLTRSLQSEIERVQSMSSETERDLRRQLDGVSNSGGGGGDWKDRYQKLEREYEDVKLDLEEQQQVSRPKNHRQVLCLLNAITGNRRGQARSRGILEGDASSFGTCRSMGP